MLCEATRGGGVNGDAMWPRSEVLLMKYSFPGHPCKAGMSQEEIGSICWSVHSDILLKAPVTWLPYVFEI